MSKTILITGTSTGFGKLTTETLSREGFEVIATMRNTEGSNAASAAALASLPGVEVVDLDVTNDQSVKKGINYVIDKYGKIDVLVNNAGVAGGGIMEAYSLDGIRQMYEINVFGVIRMYQAVLPAMRVARKGLIINLSSFLGHFSPPYLVPYNSTKFALEAISEGMQAELKQFNIENVSIISGAYPTEMNNGAKTGIAADKAHIIEAYGQKAQNDIQGFGTFISDQMQRNRPQVMADGILKLIQMEEGSRPLRYPLDVIAEGADHAFFDVVNPLKSQWADKYQITIQH